MTTWSNSCIQGLLGPVALALCMALSVPVEAAPKEAQKAAAAGRKTLPQGQARQAAPLAAVPAVLPAQVAVGQAAAEQHAVPPLAGPAPTDAPPAQATNPYLAGWYRPIEVSALPVLFVNQINGNLEYVSQAVAALSERVSGALPSLKTVHPTGGRDLVVVNVKCPAEMITGQYFLPSNLLREGINGLFEGLNETRLLSFDLQLVCG